MKTKLSFRFSVALSLLLMAALLVTAAPVRADSTITVNSTADNTTSDGLCTLREAIQNANDDAATNADCVAGSGADTITFSVSGTITLGSTLPNIADAAGLTMDGTGQTMTISGGNAVRVLMVDAFASLTLNNLTIANGSVAEDCGGGIYNSGTLTITNSTFSGNSANGWGGSGGGICNTGTLTITNSAFTGNSTGWGGSGGGIYNSGTLTITNSDFSDNSAHVWGGGGGGIYNNGTLTITNSDFSDNDASSGGGIYNSGSLTITDSTFSGNSVDYGGGGIYNFGTLTITNGTFSGNGANGGGGIANDAGTLTITNSTFSGNTADWGGGIDNTGTLTITNSALTGNRATSGGGIINFGTLTITNSTFSGNGANSGGGIVNNAGTLTITNSTFSSNTADWGAGNGGGIVNNATLIITNSAFSGNSAIWDGGGIRNDGTLNYANTIIANSTSGGDCNNYYGTIGTNTNNLVEDGSCSASLSGDPNLGALADNGGPTQTFALLTGSPAIDAGDDATCSAAPVNGLDQRGIARPQGAHCDIGSYEFVDTTPPTVVSVNRASTNPTAAASVNFTVTFSESVTGVDTSDFSLTTTGVSGAAVSGVSGSGSVYTVIVNTGTGSGTLRLDLNASGTGIQDLSGNPISGGFTGGEQYAINKSSPLLLSPSNGAILHYNRPTFDWDDFLGVTGYQIQVSRNNRFTLLVFDASTGAAKTDYTKAGNLPANLTLYWRVRAKLGTKYSAWSSVWTLHTANPPSVPSLLTPLNGALITNSFACLDWSDSTVPTGTTFYAYEVVMSDDPNSITPIGMQINSQWCSDILEPNKIFYWRVRSINTDGEYSAWSLVRTFRTALPAPISLSADGASQNLRPRFTWNMPAHPLPAPTSYTVQVSKNNTFTQVVHTGTATTMNYTPTADLPRNLTLYWHVRANGANGPSDWSAFGTYTTGNPPAVPALLSPASNALVTTYTPTLDWSQPNLLGSNFKAYRVEVATDANFASIARTAVVDVLANHFWIVDPPLDPNTKYYWHVQACNMSDECSAWSAARTFRTKLASPVLISPTDISGTSNRKPTFTWGAVTGATSYTIQVSTNSSFTTLKVNNTLTATSYTPTTDLPLGTLYWRVRANGANGPSGGAAYYTLTIPWTSTGGPWLNRGNVKILAIDQATEGTAYAVVETAGLRSLYRTTDGAQNWTLVHTFYEPFRSLAVNGTVLYLGGMDISAGKPAIWRSTDGGASWTVVYTATDVTQVYSITLAPGSTNHAYAALSSGSNGIILKTVNGVNWAPSLTLTGTFEEVAIDPSDPSRVFAGGNNNTNLAKVYRSTNSGGSWSLVLSSDTEGYDGFLTVHPENPQIVFVKTRLAGCCPPPLANLWRSTNGGTDWNIIANRPFWGPVFARPDSIYVITDTEYTLNASATTPDWQDAGAVLPEWMASSYAVEDRMAGNPLLYIGFPIEGVYTSTDHLASVQEANNGFHNLLVPRSIKLDPQNEQTLYVATDQDGFKSTNGGATWTAMNLTVQPLDFAVRPDNSDEVLMGALNDSGNGQSIFRSTDGGGTWTSVYTHHEPGTSEISYAVAFDPTDPDRAYAVSGSWSPGSPIQTAVLTSANGGQSWTTATTIDGLNPGLAVLRVDPVGIVYLAGAVWAPHASALYRSDDHGATWQKKYQGGSTHILGLTFDATDPDVVYMIEEYNLLKSTDRGETWQTILTSGKRLYSIVHDPTISGKLYLGMDGPAVWMSSNGGATWNVLGDWAGMIVATQVISLATNSDPAERILYAGLNGVWKYTNP